MIQNDTILAGHGIVCVANGKPFIFQRKIKPIAQGEWFSTSLVVSSHESIRRWSHARTKNMLECATKHASYALMSSCLGGLNFYHSRSFLSIAGGGGGGFARF